jgi:hypothetical protein
MHKKATPYSKNLLPTLWKGTYFYVWPHQVVHIQLAFANPCNQSQKQPLFIYN